jgi:hypothetical protein
MVGMFAWFGCVPAHNHADAPLVVVRSPLHRQPVDGEIASGASSNREKHLLLLRAGRRRSVISGSKCKPCSGIPTESAIEQG